MTAPQRSDWREEWPEHALLEAAERRVYMQGWWWGLCAGLIAGSMSTALLAVLIMVAKAALECPQC